MHLQVRLKNSFCRLLCFIRHAVRGRNITTPIQPLDTVFNRFARSLIWPFENYNFRGTLLFFRPCLILSYNMRNVLKAWIRQCNFAFPHYRSPLIYPPTRRKLLRSLHPEIYKSCQHHILHLWILLLLLLLLLRLLIYL